MLRALAQLDDPAFVGVLLRSLLLSLLAFAAVLAASAYGAEELVQQPGWLGWAAGIAGGLGAAILALWLFVPVALLIATLYLDRIAAAVERRFYPGLAAPQGAPVVVQAWDGIALGAQVLLLQLIALVLAFALPGIGLAIGWVITGWAIGRGLFVAVAMRRMPRADALQAYANRRPLVLIQGGLLALAGTIPLMNLLIPILGVAALTHVLNRGVSPRRLQREGAPP